MNLPLLDRDSALVRIGGDEELYRELIELFLEDSPKQLEILKSALAAGDRILGERQAHSLKSAAANIGAELLRDACHKAEQSFPSGSTETLIGLVARVDSDFEILRAHLENDSQVC